MRLLFNVVGLNLSTPLHIYQHKPALHAFRKLDMAHNLFMFLEAKQFDDLALLYFVHKYYSQFVGLVLHIDEILTIEVEWDAVLCEFEAFGRVLNEHVFFKI